MVAVLKQIAENLQLIYTELHAMNDAMYGLLVIAEALSDDDGGGD